MQIVRKEGRLEDYETTLRTKKGELRNAVLFIEYLKLSSKSLILTIIHDVTNLIRTQSALRESEARFRSMFESHGAVMLLIEPHSGSIVDANAAAEHFYGYTRSKLRSMRIQQINQYHTEKTASELNKAVEKVRNVFEFNHKISSGELRTVEVFSSPVKVFDNLLLFSIIHDITDRKRAEKALMKVKPV
jgi:PAS domain S-box-containing protein